MNLSTENKIVVSICILIVPIMYALIYIISKYNVETGTLYLLLITFVGVVTFFISNKSTFLYCLLFGTLAFNIEYPIISEGLGYDVLHIGGLRAAIVLNHFQIIIISLFLYNFFVGESVQGSLVYRKSNRKINLLLFFFVITALFSTIFSVNILASLYILLRYLTLLLLAHILLKNNIFKTLEYIVLGLIVIVSSQTLISIIQYLTDSYAGFRILGESYEPFRATSLIDESEKGVSGTLSHPGIMGLFLSLTVPLQVYFFLSKKDYKYKKIRFVSFILTIILVILTASRTSFAITLFSMISMWSFNLLLKKSIKKATLLIVVITFIPLLSIFLYSLFELGIIERFTNSDFIYQIFYRNDLNILALSVYEESSKNIILGTGLNAYTDVISSRGSGFAFEHPVHNFFLLLLVEGGLLHFLSIAVIVLYIVIILIKNIINGKQKFLAFTLFLTLIISFVYNMFGWAMYHNQNTYLITIILILSYQVGNLEGGDNE